MRYANPLGDGMGDWQSSSRDLTARQPASSSSASQEADGLPGMLLDYLRNR